MPQLHFTDRSAGISLIPEVSEFLRSDADRTAGGCVDLVDGTPFILGDDGGYDLDLNRFFRECPSIGVRSPNSVRAYARDILIWMRFLHERRDGKSLWRANRQDLIALHRARRLTDGPTQVSASTWNRSVTALESFYSWAWEEGLIATTPFARGEFIPTLTPVRYARRRSRSFREAAARQHDMRFVDMTRFVLFRDVGLRGRSPHSSVDAVWRGRTGERDALFAELLTATGLRLQEASSLLPADLPRHDDPLLGEMRSCPVNLPAAICKGNKRREIRVPRRLLKRIDDYIAIERANAVACWRKRRAWEVVNGPINVVSWERRAAVIKDADSLSSRRRLDVMHPNERARLIVAGPDGMPAEPAALWLTDNGQPMRPAAWEAAFLRADARCRSQGFDLHVTPHMLRHTFAVYMLSLLIREQIGQVVAPHDRHGAVYRRIVGDPLQKLQRLLGHSSIASTYIYLDSLEESRSLVDAAAACWADEIDATTAPAPSSC